jgi:hypothetical protein
VDQLAERNESKSFDPVVRRGIEADLKQAQLKLSK